nr:hypothetical protein [Tanacetum cinerariifolium]
TRSSAINLFPPLDNPELTILRRSRADPTLLNDFEMDAKGNGDPPVPDLRTMKEMCQPSLNGRGGSIAPIAIQAMNFGLKNDMIQQPSLNGRGGPIAPIAIQAMNFGLKNDMIQQVQNACQVHRLPGDDANKHLDIFLHVTESIKVNGVTDDALRFSITSSSDQEIVALKAKMAEINKNLMKVLQINQQVKAITPSCETSGGPYSYNDCPATVGQT